MAVLLLRLSAPLQAWGTENSKFEIRKTGREPSKSGIVGLLAAALGIRRNEPEKLRELNALRIGVRIDRAGKLLRDYQTVQAKPPYVTSRYYLSDAVFLVGLEGERELLKRIEFALSHPVFPLFLGRRSCPPTLPIVLDDIKEDGLIKVLRTYPTLDDSFKKKYNMTAHIYADYSEDDEQNSDADEPRVIGREARRDLAVSFDPRCRKHTYRTVAAYESVNKAEKDTDAAEHDAFAELEDADVSFENQA